MLKVENRDKMREYVLEFKKKEEIRKRKMNEISSSSNYLDWLNQFTIKYPSFSDDTWFYKEKKISKENLENVNDLSLLFEIIREYAINNYIYPIKDYNGSSYYNVKYKDVGYQIGVSTSQGTYFFCTKTNNIDDTFIDFNDIIMNKHQAKAELIKNKLDELSTIITYYYEHGIPFEALKLEIDNTLDNIENFKRNQAKIKKL